MTLYPYRELTITSKVQECCGWEFAAKLGQFGYRFQHRELFQFLHEQRWKDHVALLVRQAQNHQDHPKSIRHKHLLGSLNDKSKIREGIHVGYIYSMGAGMYCTVLSGHGIGK